MEEICFFQIQSSSDYPAPDTSVIPIRRHFFKMPDQTGTVRIIRSYLKKVHDYPEKRPVDSIVIRHVFKLPAAAILWRRARPL